MSCIEMLYPDAKRFALTLSYDDGCDADAKLISLLDSYGIKATFHLNSYKFTKCLDDIKECEKFKNIYKNHEVSMHTLTHPVLCDCNRGVQLYEIQNDKENLEKIFGYTVRGMSYPFGSYDGLTLDILRTLGIRYSRTTNATNGFSTPSDFLAWHPTCHQSANIDELYTRLLANRYSQLPLLYIWGHAYEFDSDNCANASWEKIENFCKKAHGNKDVWYATNIEIYDYVTAQRNLEYAEDFNTVFNPSRLTLWISKGNKIYEVKPGENEIP